MADPAPSSGDKRTAAEDGSEPSSKRARRPIPKSPKRQRQFLHQEIMGDRLEVPHATEVRTKRVCTIGPKTSDKDSLRKLMQAGMSVARFNFSHGDYEWFSASMNNVREVCAEDKVHCAIMLDTKGPEIRTGMLVNGDSITVTAGQTFAFVCDWDFPGTEEAVGVSYTELVNDVAPNDIIMVDDGLISFMVTEVVGTEKVMTRCLNDGVIGQKKGVNLPGKEVNLPAITDKDKRDIAFGVTENVDMIAASFIRRAANIDEVRDLPGVRDNNIMIIAKIESQEGVDNLEEICEAVDGIMVARGDLGVEIPIEKVCNEQKKMIRICNQLGKPVITATQMLDSMIRNPRPTRAECTDVANAVFDGTDCVMLSGETASGKFPVAAVQVMGRICTEAEGVINHRELFLAQRNNDTPPISQAQSISSSAVKTAWDIESKAIIVLTESGRTARLVAKYRPPCPILVVTPNKKTANQVLLTRGCIPVHLDTGFEDNEEVIYQAMVEGVLKNLFESGDTIVVVSGLLAGVSGSTNAMRTLVVP